MMKKIFFIILPLIFFSNVNSHAKENFFEEAKNKYDNEQIEDSKFLFQRNIVFNPKDAKSYLYLAKIYNLEENEPEELKNLKTTLLLDPKNEEAMYMLIEIELEKSNFSEVSNLSKQFNVICSNLCNKKKKIEKKLQDIQAKKESN